MELRLIITKVTTKPSQFRLPSLPSFLPSSHFRRGVGYNGRKILGNIHSPQKGRQEVIGAPDVTRAVEGRNSLA